MLVLHDGVWTSNTPQVDEEHLPEGLVEAAEGGEAGHATYVEPSLGTEVLAVAQPMCGGCTGVVVARDEDAVTITVDDAGPRHPAGTARHCL